MPYATVLPHLSVVGNRVIRPSDVVRVDGGLDDARYPGSEQQFQVHIPPA
jgi:hypothetical protein